MDGLTRMLQKASSSPIIIQSATGNVASISPVPHYRRKLAELFDKTPEELGLVKTTTPAVKPTSASLPDHSDAGPTCTLPYYGTPCIGREQEIDNIRALLARSTVYLVTLLGPGGIGKTRLAIQVATKVCDLFPDGISFISLLVARDPEQMLQAVANELSIPRDIELSLLEQVQLFLQKKHLLLILDNFEQIVGAALTLEKLIHFCPYLKILVTSREALHLQMENDFVVPPLSLPDLAHLLEPDALMHYASVELFIHYAQARLQTFQVTQNNAYDIAELCIRLDGLPLAIELAASHIKLLPPQVLLARLSKSLLILKSNVATAPARHQRLYDTIKWSYDLLNPQEQRFFRQFSAFAGGASLETIEVFFETDEFSLPEIIDCVSSLIDKSLLYSKQSEDNTSRVMMLETTRDFGLDCLRTHGEVEPVHHAYALHYLHMIEEAAPHLKGAQQNNWLQKIEQEHTNLRNALAWLIDHQETISALRFCEAFGKFCGLRGYWSEEQRWLQAALELPQIPASKAIRARVLRRAGHLAYRFRDLTAASIFYKESITLSRSLDDKYNLAGALSGQGRVLYRQNDIDEADQLFQESVDTARVLADTWVLANVLESRGCFLYYQGKTNEAYISLQEGLALARNLQDKETGVRILTTLVAIEIIWGRTTQAATLAEESVELARELNTRPLIALTLDTLGDIAILQGKDKLAITYIEQSIGLAYDLGDELAIASRKLKLVKIALLQEDTQAILAFLQDRSKLFSKLYDIPGLAVVQENCQKYIDEKKKNNPSLELIRKPKW
jgi:predicted ATPase